MTGLVDTNVLVYAAGLRTDAEKERTAVQVLARLRPEACLSLQVLAEFSAVVLRHGMGADVCRANTGGPGRSGFPRPVPWTPLWVQFWNTA